MTRFIAILLTVWTLCGVATSCGSSARKDLPPGDTLTHNSQLLTLVDHRNGVISAVVADPWKPGSTLATYLLVSRGTPDDSVPDIEDAIRIDVPLRSALVYSSVHTSAFDELGVIDLVTGVADADYFAFGPLPERIRSGRVKNVGNSMSPSLEAIVDLSPEAALVSPYQNAGFGVLDKTGIAIVQMADYMESTPLARAEWILLIGALTGRLDEARTIYGDVTARYTALRDSAALTAPARRPVVVTELPMSGTWYQPGGRSYQASMLRDAGARPLLDSDTSTGSVQMDESTVFDRGADAAIWLMCRPLPTSAADIRSAGPLAARMGALASGNVWNVNSAVVPLFDDIAFHPERILADYINIVAGNDKATTYYKRVH